MKEIKVKRKEIQKIMRSLEERKPTGPDGVSRHSLKECRQQLIEPMHKKNECSLKTGKIPKERKRTDIITI